MVGAPQTPHQSNNKGAEKGRLSNPKTLIIRGPVPIVLVFDFCVQLEDLSFAALESHTFDRIIVRTFNSSFQLGGVSWSLKI